MILQALNQYYDRLVEAGTLERSGWQPVKVPYALQIDDEGRLKRVLPLLHEEDRGKKKVMVPQNMNVPAQEKRSVGIVSNFLCDNASYILGIDGKGKPERSIRCFQACKELHEAFLGGVDSPAAQAVVNFFRHWEPSQAREHEALKPYLEELMSGGNLVFDYHQQFVQTYPEIQAVWDKHYAAADENTKARCLVTGEMSPVAVLHPNVKGVTGGQPTGTALVSFNASAFESYGHDGEQGRNAPVSEKAAFAYTSALNYMIAEKGHHIRLSDATIVFWAEHGQDAYAQEFTGMMGEANGISEDDLLQSLKHLAAGRKANLNDFELNPEEHFYVLGLSPNAARLSVRFFLQDSFGVFARNLLRHHERLHIVKPAFDSRAFLSFWHLLNETVNQKSRDKTPSPLLSGALVRAVLMNQSYPRLLLDQVEIRIRAEREVNRGRAAIIKAYLLKLYEKGALKKQCEEALQVELNENTTYQPYLLGRLFSILEDLQIASMKKDNPNKQITATIRDRYFNSACSTPAIVFPQLIKLAQAHLKKLGGGLEKSYNEKIGSILEKVGESYLSRLDLNDQGIFQLGYYHQTQARYTKKEDKKDE